MTIANQQIEQTAYGVAVIKRSLLEMDIFEQCIEHIFRYLDRLEE